MVLGWPIVSDVIVYIFLIKIPLCAEKASSETRTDFGQTKESVKLSNWRKF